MTITRMLIPEKKDSLPDVVNTENVKKEATKKAEILVVEDNAELLQFIQDTLKRSYKTYTAMNGQDAFEKALEKTPTLLFRM